MPDLANKRVTVMGLGRFGGGVGVTRWLCRHGADVLVTDTDPADKLTDSIAAIQPLIDRGQVRLRLGEHNVSDFTTCDLVVANVAVPKPWDNRYLRAAEAAGIPITTEIALLIDCLPPAVRDRTIGITGSAGKSTTTAMIHHALTAVAASRTGEGKPWRAVLGGNIGGSLLDQVDTFDDRTWLVLELSSAMLYWLERMQSDRPWSPRVAVITNISPNHIDWHGDFEHYRRSKLHLVRHQRPGDIAVLDPVVAAEHAPTAASVQVIDPAAFPYSMTLPGEHNRINAAAAMLACHAIIGEDLAALRLAHQAISGFRGLAHRLQLVAETRMHGPTAAPCRMFNDSKSTTPESCLKALEALQSVPGLQAGCIHLIAGGYDKGSDLTPIARAAASLAGLYTIGKTGPGLAALAGPAADGRVHQCHTLEHAFDEAVKRLKPGDALLLSPGCASWDQFINFEQRGDLFISLVERIKR